MTKTKFNFKRWTALRLIVAMVLLSIGPTAEAGILQWLAGSPLVASAATDSALVYLSPAGLNIPSTAQLPAPTDQFTTIQDSYIVQPGAPTKTTAKPVSIRSELVVVATGYSSTPDQTDASPFTTAWGTTVHDGIVAANFLPFGTQVKLPAMFGDKIFTVEDRMNARYDQRVDLWFPDRASALQFGLRTVKLQILGL